MSSSQYEREIKGILEGDKKIITKITKSCSLIEKNNYITIFEKPFVVIRAAGSFGIDLVAIRGDISFLLEVKTSIEKTIHFSSINGKLQKQADTMQKICEKTKTLPIYAYRIKNHRGDSWNEKSRNNNYIMRWENGLSLSDFIFYLCR
jgi:Holliday junction resolvase